MATIAKIQQAASDAEATPNTLFYTSKGKGIGVVYDSRHYEYRIYNRGHARKEIPL